MMLLFCVLNIICGSVQIQQRHLYLRSVSIFNENENEQENISPIDECSGIGFHNEDTSSCENCPKGTINNDHSQKNFNVCSKCILNFYHSKENSKCIECQTNSISSLKNFHNDENCSIKNKYRLDEVLENGEVKKCSEIIKDSSKRDPDTPPLSIFCKCSGRMAKMYFKKSIYARHQKLKCVGFKLMRDIIGKKEVDYAVITTYRLNREEYQYINCDPYREKYDVSEYCLCPPGYIFTDFKCKLCVDYEPANSNREHHCIKCPPNKHLSLDGQSCMCPYSYKPQSAECGEPTENDMHCTGNLALINGTCQLCPGKKIKSKINGQCICPYSKKLLDDDCIECNAESSNSENCSCGGNAENNRNKCQCKSNQFLNDNNECIDCPKGYILSKTEKNTCICPIGKFITQENECVYCPKGFITSNINQNSCFCPTGKFINGHDICVECSKGKISTKINESLCHCPIGSFINTNDECIKCVNGEYSTAQNSDKCLSCNFFKVTSETGLKSGKFCDKIDTLKILLFILPALLVIIIAIIIAAVFYLKKKSKSARNRSEESDLNKVTKREKKSRKGSANKEIYSKSKNIEDEYINYDIAKEALKRSNARPQDSEEIKEIYCSYSSDEKRQDLEKRRDLNIQNKSKIPCNNEYRSEI